MDINFTASYASHLDESDELNSFRKRFELNDQNLIYLDGNSLGVLPVETKSQMSKVIEQEWGEGLIRSWNSEWYDRPTKIGAKIAKLIGAKPHEVIVADSTTVNLFKLAFAALNHQPEKKEIVTDEFNFPSDLYVLQGLIDILGNKHTIALAKSNDGITISDDELYKRITSNTAVVTLSHVVFKSSFMYNMHEVTQLAQSKGAMVLWDLSHAVGSVPVKLNECNVDLAIGCTYKYLNGGPGSPAFLYVREDLQDKLKSPLWGWFGQHKPFDFSLEYKPAKGIKRFFAGTPPLLSLSSIDSSIDIIQEAGIEKIREKSIKQSGYLIALFEKLLVPLGFQLGSPLDFNQRGSHVSIRHPEAYRICKALIDEKIGGKVVIPDFREPDNIRIGIAPLYNTYIEIFESVMQLKEIVETRKYLDFAIQRDNVT